MTGSTADAATVTVAAIDIGASSGRVVAGVVTDRTVSIEVVHRFANGLQTVDGRLRWDLTGLYAEVLTGLTELASRYPDVVSIANTALNQTGRAVECIAIIMAVYLVTSLSTSAFMNWYNKRAAIL
jgi:sugar (pentulose or hexulose) kinase